MLKNNPHNTNDDIILTHIVFHIIITKAMQGVVISSALFGEVGADPIQTTRGVRSRTFDRNTITHNETTALTKHWICNTYVTVNLYPIKDNL